EATGQLEQLTAVDGPCELVGPVEPKRIHGLTVRTPSSPAGVNARPRRSVPGKDALSGEAAGHGIGGGGFVLPAARIALDPPTQYPLITSRQGSTVSNQKFQLLPAEPVEFAGRIVGGDNHRAAQKGHCFGRESGCRQQHFGCAAVDLAAASPCRGSEPKVELSVGAGQAFQAVVVNQSGDIGVAVGAGLVDNAIRVEVENGVHVVVLSGAGVKRGAKVKLHICNLPDHGVTKP